MDYTTHCHRAAVQVRALCACELGLWTASRDKTVKLWTEVDQRHFALSSTLVCASKSSIAYSSLSAAYTKSLDCLTCKQVGHTSFVGSIAYSAELRQQSPQGFLLSGMSSDSSSGLVHGYLYPEHGSKAQLQCCFRVAASHARRASANLTSPGQSSVAACLCKRTTKLGTQGPRTLQPSSGM